MRRCYRGVRLRKTFLGFEPLDGLILFCVYWLGAVVGGRTALALVLVTLAGALLRLFKGKRLPGAGVALTSFLLTPAYWPSFGQDPIPRLPPSRRTSSCGD